jgi:hypothetical protein
MGGMFHGAIGAGGGAGNNIKSLSSRSGNKLNWMTERVLFFLPIRVVRI